MFFSEHSVYQLQPCIVLEFVEWRNARECTDTGAADRQTKLNGADRQINSIADFSRNDSIHPKLTGK